MASTAQTFDKRTVFRLAADKIERDPELLLRSRETLNGWLSNGVTPRRRLENWIDRIDRALVDAKAMDDLLFRLRDESEDAEFDREFSPFGLLLSKAERRQLTRECAYSH